MRANSSITIFERIQRKNRIIKRAIAFFMVVVVALTTCFSSNFTKKKANAAVAIDEPGAYLVYVIEEMQKDPARNFVVLEIVPDQSQGEFIYYCAQKEVTDKLQKLNQTELEYIYNRLADGSKTVNFFGNIEQVYAKDSSGNYVGGTTSNFGFKLRKNALSGKYDIKLENVFLENVIPEYYGFLEDRLEVRCIEANDVTIEDVREADLIYLNSKMHDSTKSVYQVMSVISAAGDTRGTVPAIENFKADGTLLTSDPNYSDYEFVETGSAEDLAYTTNLKKYNDATSEQDYTYDAKSGIVKRDTYSLADKADKAKAVYETIAHTYNGKTGYLKSRDISWDVAEELLKLNMEGKNFYGQKDEDGNPAVAKVPILMDHTGMTSYTQTNMYKLVTTLYTITNREVLEVKDKVSEQKVKITGYDLLKKLMTSELEAYNPYGLRTGLLDFSYYDNTSISTSAIKDCGKDLTKASAGSYKWNCDGKYVTSAGDWSYYYTCWDAQDLNSTKGYKAYVSKDAQYEFDITDAYTLNEWNGVKKWVMLNCGYNETMTNQNYQVAMGDNFWKYNGTGALIPVNRFDAGGCAFADTRIEPNAAGNYPTIDIIRYLLGAKGKPDFDPGPLPTGEPATVELNILEIEPSNIFTYAPGMDKTDLTYQTNVATWLSRVTEMTYKHDSGNLYKSDEDPSATMYKVNVDGYTVNAVNGLNKDLIAEYDMIYLGVNDYATGGNSIIKQVYGEGSALYFPKSGSMNANDLTVAKKDEIVDFVKSGKILLLDYRFSNTLAVNTSNVFGLIGAVGIGKNVIFSGVASGGVYSDRDVFYYYDSKCTPKITVTSVNVDGTEAAKNGDEIVYDGDDIITSYNGTSFTVNYKVTNCDPEKFYVVAFYIDENNDGIYGNTPSECREVAMAVDALGNNAVSVHPTTGEIGFANSFTRTLSADFNSALASWKICVYEAASTGTVIKSIANETQTVNNIKRDTAIGQVPLIKTGGYDQDIRVLHIVGEGASDVKLSDDADFMEYLEKAAEGIDYNATVTSKKMNEITTAMVTSADDDYDVIVVGLGAYSTLDLNANAKNLIKAWIDNNDSIIFMNDLANDMVTDTGATLAQFEQIAGTQTTGNKKGIDAAYTATLNDGPITQYPYNISGDDISVSATEPLYFQTLLDYKTDAEGNAFRNNVVVWNTLTNGSTDNSNYFDAIYKDATNNPYIYTISNLTYMGMNSIATDSEKKLLINAIIRAVVQPQWVETPSIVVNNGIMTAGGYNIYVDIDYIQEVATEDEAAANQLRSEEYYIDFTPRNPDGTDMDGKIFWHYTPEGGTTQKYTLAVYDSTTALGRLKDGEMRTIQIAGNADLKAGLDAIDPALYPALINEIEMEKVHLEIFVENDYDRNESKRVTFKQRKMYNLK